MSSAPPRFNVLGTGVSALSLAEARDVIIAARAEKQEGYVCCATAYNVNLARSDFALRAAYNHSRLTTPDGMPLVWLGRWHGHKSITRVYGPDILLAACDAGRRTDLKHYFYGGNDGVAESLREKLCARFPGLLVVGTFTPPFRALSETELAALRADVASKKPDVIWVGLSTPKQEKFMAEIGPSLATGILVGVGAAFDFHSGRIKQAPRWMQRSGLEWLFRLGTDPVRLWKRYLIHNPLFVLRTVAQLSGLKKYSLTTNEHE
ncbi:WecB/TagA/CpsF family glycosyltransferase [Oleiharenicola lentus]|uniref:WecB/TagA/CpsF family glycosyltransferase n=1 Tax=Oleiharenicola lentus TaxID=2508720 RepID=UPI003F667F10